MAQLLQYNCYARNREGTATYRHSEDRDIPFTVFLGKSEMLVPWKEVVAVVAVGLWSMLSITAVVNNPFLVNAGQTTPSFMYLFTILLSLRKRFQFHPRSIYH
jgi:hypothetical protein